MIRKFLSVTLLFFAFVLIDAIHVFAASSPVTSRKIVIDPGHGGTDWGSTECPGLAEKDANLDISRRLQELLANDGAQVLMTRTDDSYKSNNDRYTQANQFGGQVLVSVHLNGSTNHTKNGTLGLYGKRNKDLEFAKTLHQRMVSEVGVPDLGITNFASGVLLKANMPATIAETVFISNTAECSLLTDGTGNRQQKIAQSLYYGISDWFAR
ncbi:MAG: hypothetical protein A3F04_00175 [Candidatus Chisholmbacteria bacterium RIFCSPHIGHO2_12_FULL_49_9]|uniref:MurNAc-LAA domain-containing protein n=1 Tax=Candidatus Chisholmbacteria bacterium RIFCSPHIGHO2_01_FULL_52_32 TaxID=1797591 RepID=A0A1G1VS83_9BACT|nr:MAG: hypothetical protein A2786_02015 [Candidatus Chisholmbacteria bacterium RIFCSPHIGHO2_01_FULL_52_32]OGY19131.1 MAG: hypothetical protein A3F04_00175 [Candidatus Chisholmbacteria bacterium RIFCSPHIGHO2_12_FULL_49_9]OGY20352.1 MAG: hypothetical protein A2900_04730 [Candidatus Chisholmbacteria bacterium RIFCSPLOWO2_01_FULL_50_28]